MVERGVVLVAGGAGYVGSHVVLAPGAARRPMLVPDDRSTGYGQGHAVLDDIVRDALRFEAQPNGRPA